MAQAVENILVIIEPTQDGIEMRYIEETEVPEYVVRFIKSERTAELFRKFDLWYRGDVGDPDDTYYYDENGIYVMKPCGRQKMSQFFSGLTITGNITFYIIGEAKPY